MESFSKDGSRDEDKPLTNPTGAVDEPPAASITERGTSSTSKEQRFTQQVSPECQFGARNVRSCRLYHHAATCNSSEYKVLLNPAGSVWTGANIWQPIVAGGYCTVQHKETPNGGEGERLYHCDFAECRIWSISGCITRAGTWSGAAGASPWGLSCQFWRPERIPLR